MRSFRMILVCFLILWAACGRAREPSDTKDGRMSRKEARILLSAHAVRDAAVLTPGGTRDSSPALADMDGDGDLEIVAVAGGGWLGVWHHDGRPMKGWPVFQGGMHCSPAVGDVDGTAEIALPGCLYGADGCPLAGWPLKGRASPFCTPSLDDVDGDGDLEILSTDIDSGVCIHHHDGTNLAGWPVSLPKNDIRSTPQAYDLDHDGEKEIIFLSGPEQEIRIHRLDGSLHSRIPFPGIWVVTDSFILADMNVDGSIELVYRGNSVDLTTGEVVTLGWTGGDAPCLLRDDTTGKPTLGEPRVSRDSYGEDLDVSDQEGVYSDGAVAGDIDGDGQVEILFGNWEGGFHAYRQSGGQAAGWPKKLNPSGDCGMAIGDLDGDGDLEVVANTGGGRMYVFDCPGPATGSVPWPLLLGNNRRTGFPDPSRPLRAKPARAAPGETAQGLSAALASGDWTTALDIYQRALAALEESQEEGDADLRQLGLLSLARILNTRARRFEEAAEYYRRAVETSPGTWLACQGLGECAALVSLYPDLIGARDSLAGIVEACLQQIDVVEIPEADLFRCELMMACLLVERHDQLQRLAESVSREGPRDRKGYTADIAKGIAAFEGYPFIVEFLTDATTRYHSIAKDLVLGETVEGETEYQLIVNPRSPSLEPFPFTMKVSVDRDEDIMSDEDWDSGLDGRWMKTIEGDARITGMNRFSIFRRRVPVECPMIRREAERMDQNRFMAKFFVRTPLPRVVFGLAIGGGGGSFVRGGITPPHGAYLELPGEIRFSASGTCRCGCRRPVSDYFDVVKGGTMEVLVELFPNSSPFYPEIGLNARQDTRDVIVDEVVSEHKVRGSFEGIDFEISSPRRFKIASREARMVRNWAFSLEARGAEVQ